MDREAYRKICVADSYTISWPLILKHRKMVRDGIGRRKTAGVVTLCDSVFVSEA